jgi:hypothetical protein
LSKIMSLGIKTINKILLNIPSGHVEKWGKNISAFIFSPKTTFKMVRIYHAHPVDRQVSQIW